MRKLSYLMCAVRCVNKTIMFAVIELDTVLNVEYTIYDFISAVINNFSTDFINELVKKSIKFWYVKLTVNIQEKENRIWRWKLYFISFKSYLRISPFPISLTLPLLYLSTLALPHPPRPSFPYPPLPTTAPSHSLSLTLFLSFGSSSFLWIVCIYFL